MSNTDMVEVYQPQNLIELNAIMAYLGSDGLWPVVIEAEDGPWRIQVPEEQAERARKLIDDYLKDVQGTNPNQPETEEQKESRAFNKTFSWVMILLTLMGICFLFFGPQCRG